MQLIDFDIIHPSSSYIIIIIILRRRTRSLATTTPCYHLYPYPTTAPISTATTTTMLYLPICPSPSHPSACRETSSAARWRAVRRSIWDAAWTCWRGRRWCCRSTRGSKRPVKTATTITSAIVVGAIVVGAAIVVVGAVVVGAGATMPQWVTCWQTACLRGSV